NELPHPHPLGAKSTSAALQVQFPHAAKRVVVSVFQFVPPCIEPLEPRHQSLVVMTAMPSMEIFKDQVLADTVHDICESGKLHPRHDVLIVPRIDRLLLQIAHGMQQEYAGRLQASLTGAKEVAIMPAAHVLEHADRHHPV